MQKNLPLSCRARRGSKALRAAPDQTLRLGAAAYPVRLCETAEVSQTVPRVSGPSVARLVQALRSSRQTLQEYRQACEQAQEQIRNLGNYRQGLDQHSIVAVTDHRGRIVYANDMFCAISGYGIDELIGQTHRVINSGTHPPEFFRAMWQNILQGLTWRAEVCNRNKQGQLYWVDTTVVPTSDARTGERQYISIRTDITERKLLELDLRHAATTDRLTGLLNRDGMSRGLEEALQRHRHRGDGLVVLFLDIDHFKRVNDALGHRNGDALLQRLAERVRMVLQRRGGSPIAFAARVGGDEFALVVMQEGVPWQPNQLTELAKTVMAQLAGDYALGGYTVSVQVSVGVSVADAQSTSDSLLHDADLAMYEAKRRGRGCMVLHDSEMGARIHRARRVEVRLKDALRQGQVGLVYQPIVRADSQRVVGFEALARWTDTELGVISPAEFIPIAEEAGLINELGRHTLDQACADFAQLRKQAGASAPDYVSVNVSRMQFHSPRLLDDITGALSRHGLSPHQLCVEVTETAVMTDEKGMVRILSLLHAQGVRIALDDFGTGYSSLASLQSLPLTAVKLDRSFVIRLGADAAAEVVLRAGISMVAALGLTSIAEGVESAHQAQLLAQFGCAQLQGYHCGRPASLAHWLGVVSV